MDSQAAWDDSQADQAWDWDDSKEWKNSEKWEIAPQTPDPAGRWVDTRSKEIQQLGWEQWQRAHDGYGKAPPRDEDLGMVYMYIHIYIIYLVHRIPFVVA